MPSEVAAGERRRVWDIPTRAFHWLVVLLVPFSWWSAKTGHLPWHRISGCLILALLLFRLGWGVFGAQTSRFSDFVRGPKALLAQIQGRATLAVGHSPLGGLSVMTMLAALILQVGLGLFAVDQDGFEGGPLSRFLDFDTGRAIAKVHHLTFYLIIGLVAVHLAAIAFYEVRRKRLVVAMITGDKVMPPGVAQPVLARPWVAVLGVLIAGGIAWFVAHGMKFTGAV